MRAFRRLPVLLAVALTLGAGAGAAAQPPARPTSDAAAYEIAAQLRCVVCQNLSVADSPSEMAAQMRAIVRERLAAGDSPAQVRQYFVERYGEWILLEPKREGFTLLVWVVPPVAVTLGFLVVGILLRRWTRRRAPGVVESAPARTVDPAMADRIRRELEDP